MTIGTAFFTVGSNGLRGSIDGDGRRQGQATSTAKTATSARDLAVASAGTAAHTSADHASADRESQPVDKPAQGQHR